jgi:hypothetical protein
MMVVYEIHTFRDGAWKIDSIFDDRDLAMLEAQRVERAKRYSGVRVVEETFDEVTDKTVTRTIYRSSRVDKPNTEAFHRRAEAIQHPTRPRPSRPEQPAKRPASLHHVLVVATLTAGAILFSGLGAIYALNALTH